MKLPDTFLESMKSLLGEAFDEWLAAYDAPSYQGLRINTAKLTPEAWEHRLCLFACHKIPWTDNGYYVPDAARPAKDPYYYAGLYYLQEPSAMAPAACLPVKPGDAVLDLCAAPGGKSTELGARLEGEGILVANDISNSRARALLKNLELFGIPNICVTSEAPEKLADTFGMFFDKILVDAPCSGEGMFRKDPDLIKSWLEHGPEYYAPIQKEILRQAVRMLKPGGYLLYSTCTFAVEEDEAVIDWILGECPEMELATISPWDGAAGGVDGKPVIRLFPHRIRGEGHFLALLCKRGGAEMSEMLEAAGTLERPELSEIPHLGRRSGPRKLPVPPKVASISEQKISSDIRSLEKESDFAKWEALLDEKFDRNRLMIKDNLVYYLPAEFDRSWKLRYLRTGLLLGEWKKKRFEPSQAVAMTLGPDRYQQIFSLRREDERVLRYLKGETIALEPGEAAGKGWVLVCVDGYPLGWAKYAGNTLKNKYYPGWRWQ